jgi:hypothetical protein
MRFGKLATLVLASISTAALVAWATPAGAATAPVTTVTTDMHVIGFDAAVAAAHGYEIRTGADGRQYSVKKESADGTVNPLNVVSGNCGISYVYEYGIGNRAIELYTGYSVIRDVVRWHWQVRLDDRGGSSYRNYAGGVNLGIWQVDQVIGGLTRGGARATVMSGQSYTVLDTGAVCVSGAPFDDTTIT